ncbi:2-oxo-hept-4-ene-1,7-dioate hydratase [Arenibacterium halophilum]|uniref:2-oxo-hepta-3-ene-1,7-dioic acid hydratase n=1 Tax=Arenibacterium halophilum TaxID=2583821 RepID=A0ABY2X8F9_9RHOB|nr:2-oxo-hepta-3-ene-1,7-dioic acid hydratase [Arenibacterium halophilum]TMV12657.1 2-oxo-hepta-3-ene-1,7-dioic acid hydratase [Arenibacterium halophilum]
MLDRETVQGIARKLEDAEANATQIAQVSETYPDMEMADAYAIQNAWRELKIASGRVIRGHKIGLTSRAMQQAVGIDEPDYGFLTDEMFLGEGAKIDTSRLIEPKIEAELAFVLNRDLTGPDCTIFDVLDATAYVIPALELLDARIERISGTTGARRRVFDTISDNAANCAIICGGRPMRPMDFDMRREQALVFRNGVIEETGVAAGVLNHPANGIAWLANRLHQWGEGLRAGETVLSGSFIRPIDARAGDTFTADYGDLGSVSVSFT